MHPRLQEIVVCLDRELAALRASVAEVPPADRERRPAPDRWSVAEVLEHVAAVEVSVTRGCAHFLARAREAGLAPESDTASLAHTLRIEAIAARDRKLVSPDTLVPKGMTADAAWAEIERARAGLKQFMVEADGLALAEVSFPHPALGPLNLYQWLLFAAGHHARHAAQIREIARQLR